MTRRITFALVLFGLILLAAAPTGRAQPGVTKLPDPKDEVFFRGRAKDGTSVVKSETGLFKVSSAGFQVVRGDAPKFETIMATIENPDDIVKVSIGELGGIERVQIQSAERKEIGDKRDLKAAQKEYKDLADKAGLPDRSKRYLDFKVAHVTTKIVDELDDAGGWKARAEEAVLQSWGTFLGTHTTGWELWPAVRASTRLQIELGKFKDAASTWKKITGCKDMPPEVQIEAEIQSVDLYFRAKEYANASAIDALINKTVGAKKQRLLIYQAAAKEAGANKFTEAVAAVKALLDKPESKDPSVQATAFGVMGELYLAANKPRDAMWMFLWVETVTNQDKDEVLKAMVRLVAIFDAQKDEEQVKKYTEKIKRYRGSF